MDLKQQAAKAAVEFIKDEMIIGLGAGATMAYMVTFLKEQKLNVQVYSSSAGTITLLMQHGFMLKEIADACYLDLYFDGCDQFDKGLNALKSGAGIHTIEKLFASMAKEFILVGDESKYAERFTNTYPVVLEVLPQAKTYVPFAMKQLYNDAVTTYRKTATGNYILTENNNYLLDLFFTEIPEPALLNNELKNITGVVETSLFYNLACKAITASANGINVFTKAYDNKRIL